VHYVRAQSGHQGIEIRVGVHPGVQVRRDGDQAGRTGGAIVAAYHQVLLVAARQGVEEPEQSPVGAPSITKPIRDVENPH